MLATGVSKAVLVVNGMKCRYCGGEASAADHIIPQRLGGPDEASNLVAACQPCNSRKGGARLPIDIEKELRMEAWIMAPEVEHLARVIRRPQKTTVRRGSISWIMAPDVEHLACVIRHAQKTAVRRGPISLVRDPYDQWQIL